MLPQPGSRLDTVLAQGGDMSSPEALYQPPQKVQNTDPSIPLTGYNSGAALGTDAMLRQAAENLNEAERGESGSADDGAVRSQASDNINDNTDDNDESDESIPKFFALKQTDELSWEEQMERLFRKRKNTPELPNNATLNLGESGELYAEFGMNNLPIAMERGVVSKALRKKKGNRSAHELTESDIRALQHEINHPVAIIDETDRNSVMVVTSRVDNNGNPIVAAISKNIEIDYRPAHRITSVYGRVNLQRDFASAEDRGDKTEVYNEKRLQELTSVEPVTDREDTGSSEADDMIPHNTDDVKPNFLASKALTADDVISRLKTGKDTKAQIKSLAEQVRSKYDSTFKLDTSASLADQRSDLIDAIDFIDSTNEDVTFPINSRTAEKAAPKKAAKKTAADSAAKTKSAEKSTKKTADIPTHQLAEAQLGKDTSDRTKAALIANRTFGDVTIPVVNARKYFGEKTKGMKAWRRCQSMVYALNPNLKVYAFDGSLALKGDKHFGGEIHGFYYQGNLYINVAALTDGMRRVTAHEICHDIIKINPQALQAYYNLRRAWAERTGKLSEFESRINDIINDRIIDENDPNSAFEELMCDDFGDFMMNEDFAAYACGENISLWKRIAWSIGRVLEKIAPFNKEMRELHQLQGFMLEMAQNYRTANAADATDVRTRGQLRDAAAAQQTIQNADGRYQPREVRKASQQRFKDDASAVNRDYKKITSKNAKETTTYGYTQAQIGGEPVRVYVVNPNSQTLNREHKANLNACRQLAASLGLPVAFTTGNAITISRKGEGTKTYSTFTSGGITYINLDSNESYTSLLSAAIYDKIAQANPARARELTRLMDRVSRLAGDEISARDAVRRQLHNNSGNAAKTLRMTGSEFLSAISSDATLQSAVTENPTLMKRAAGAIGDLAAMLTGKNEQRAQKLYTQAEARILHALADTAENNSTPEGEAITKTAKPPIEGAKFMNRNVDDQSFDRNMLEYADKKSQSARTQELHDSTGKALLSDSPTAEQTAAAEAKAEERGAKLGKQTYNLSDDGSRRVIYESVSMKLYTEGDEKLAKEYKKVSTLSRIMGVKVVWYLGDLKLTVDGKTLTENMNGYYHNGTIFINAAAIDSAYSMIFGHELWHHVESKVPGATRLLYVRYRMFGLDTAIGDKFSDDLQTIADQYGYDLATHEGKYAAFEEYLANRYGEMFTDEFVQYLESQYIESQDRSLWGKIKRTIAEVIAKLRANKLTQDMPWRDKLDAFTRSFAEKATGTRQNNLREAMAAAEVKERLDARNIDENSIASDNVKFMRQKAKKPQYATLKGRDLIEAYDKDSYNRSGWAYVNKVMTPDMTSKFMRKIAEIKTGTKAFKCNNGGYIVEFNIDDKVYTDGNWDAPSIDTVIVFEDADIFEIVNDIKEDIYAYERRGFKDAVEITTDYYGEILFNVYNLRDFPSFQEQKRIAEGSAGTADNRDSGALPDGR